jgi:sarcosine oxidase
VQPVDVEVVVVGAGVMGLAAARALAHAGHDVVVLEQYQLGHDHGSSHGGSRIIRLSYPEASWVRLAQEAYPLWRELEAEVGRPLLELHGTIDLGDWTPNRDALAACDIPFEVLDGPEIERRFPIRMEPGERGLFQEDGGIVYADLAVEALAASAAQAGAELREGVRVESVKTDRDSVTVGGVQARAAIVTAGAWAPKLFDVAARPTRETVSYFAFEEPLPSVIDTTTAAEHGYALIAPAGKLKAGLHKSGPEIDPDEPDGPDPGVAEKTAGWVTRRFGDRGTPIGLETCLYTIRENDEFLLERQGRVVVGSPCSGHGFKFAPVIGKRLAALALEAL